MQQIIKEIPLPLNRNLRFRPEPDSKNYLKGDFLQTKKLENVTIFLQKCNECNFTEFERTTESNKKKQLWFVLTSNKIVLTGAQITMHAHILLMYCI